MPCVTAIGVVTATTTPDGAVTKPDRMKVSGGLRSRAARATVARIAGYVISKGVQVVGTVILAHLIATPRVWGVLILAQSVLQGLKMFSEVGIGPAIIQDSQGTSPTLLDTAWTIQVVRGLAIWLVGTILAWPVSVLYQEPTLLWMMPVMGLANVLAGFQGTSVYVLNRELAEGRRTVLELVERVVTRGMTIVLAFATPTAWAFVWASLIGNIVLTAGTHTYLPGHRNRFRFDAAAAKRLVHFGRWIFIGTVIAFFSTQADRLLLGKIDDLAGLGVYGIALTVSKLPQELIGVLASIIFPVMAHIARESPARYASAFARMRNLLLGPAVAAVLAVVLGSPWLFRLFYPQSFQAAGWMASLSAGAVWFAIWDMAANKALLAAGETRALAVGGFLDLTGTVIGCLLGYYVWGMAGFILGTVFGSICGYAYLQWVLSSRGITVVREDARWTLMVGMIALAGYIASDVAMRRIGGFEGVVVGMGLAVIIVCIASIWATRRTLSLWKGSMA